MDLDLKENQLKLKSNIFRYGPNIYNLRSHTRNESIRAQLNKSMSILIIFGGYFFNSYIC